MMPVLVRRSGGEAAKRFFAGMTRVKHSSRLLVIGAEKVLDILSKTGLCSAVSVSAVEAKVWRGWRGF
jgi:hypothetical protein